MGCGTITLKSCLGFISFFFWISAVALIVIGSLILSDYGNYSQLVQSTDILIPSVILISAGVFLFVVGLLGCVGGMKRHKGALSAFFVITLVVMVGEIVAVALGYQYRDQVHDKLTNRIHDVVRECGNGTAHDQQAKCDEMDFIQQHLGCCGADSYKDWYNSSNSTYPIPQSCCRVTNCQTPARGTSLPVANKTIYTEGCSDLTSDLLEEYYSWIFVATVLVVILQVLGLVATCIMLFRSQETPYLVLDSQGYRV